MIKLAVFDLDGTLVDSLTDLALSVNKGLKKAGLPEHPIGKYNKFVGNGREMLIRRAIGEGCTEELFEAVIGTFDREYRLHCNDNTAAYDGCADMLKRLSDSGIHTAVLSNKPDEFVPQIMEKLYPGHSFLEAWGQNASPTPKRFTLCSLCTGSRLTSAYMWATATSTCSLRETAE